MDIKCEIGGVAAASIDGNVSVDPSIASFLSLKCAGVAGPFRSCSLVKTFGNAAAKSHDCDNGIKFPRPLVFGNVFPVTIGGAAVRSAAAASFIRRNSLFSATNNGFSLFATDVGFDCSCDVLWALSASSIVRYTVVSVWTQKRCNGMIKFGKFFSNQRQTKPTLSVSCVLKKHDCVTVAMVRFIYKLQRE